MNPYEKTAEEMKRQSEGPKRFAKGALSAAPALAAASFAPILSRAAPFLSQYIPEDFAIKGLSKISPKLGNFVKEAMDGGYGFEQVKDFIGEQINQSQNQDVKENLNIIQKYSPELHEFLDQEVRKGRAPLEAGALARAQGFDKIISKIEKDNNANWSSIIETVFGGAKNASPQNQSPENEAQPQSTAALQGSDANAQLMQMMQKFMDVLKG